MHPSQLVSEGQCLPVQRRTRGGKPFLCKRLCALAQLSDSKELGVGSAHLLIAT